MSRYIIAATAAVAFSFSAPLHAQSDSESEGAPDITASSSTAGQANIAGMKPSKTFSFTKKYNLAAETEAALNSPGRSGTRMTQAKPVNAEGYSILASTDENGAIGVLDITM